MTKYCLLKDDFVVGKGIKVDDKNVYLNPAKDSKDIETFETKETAEALAELFGCKVRKVIFKETSKERNGKIVIR